MAPLAAALQIAGNGHAVFLSHRMFSMAYMLPCHHVASSGLASMQGKLTKIPCLKWTDSMGRIGSVTGCDRVQACLDTRAHNSFMHMQLQAGLALT